MKKEDVTKTELKKAAKELNGQLGLEPPILLDVKVKALEKKVIEAAALIDPEEDEFSDGVWDILEALECAARPGSEDDGDAEPEDGDAAGEVLDVESEDADAAVEEAVEDTLVEDFKAAKKLADLKTMVSEWECFSKLDLDAYKGLQAPRQLRADMLECLPEDVREQIEPKAAEKPVKDKAEKKDKPIKEKKEKESTVTMNRVEAAVKAYTEIGDPEITAVLLSEPADAAYVAAGGKSNVKESLGNCKKVLSMISACKKYDLFK
jgi:hypothetical protein